ncbi:MAG: amidohydrolase family protein [Nitrospinota bacterium]|nr:MAG: amidohydrolase family protein [Nitrospinota bacterium]
MRCRKNTLPPSTQRTRRRMEFLCDLSLLCGKRRMEHCLLMQLLCPVPHAILVEAFRISTQESEREGVSMSATIIFTNSFLIDCTGREPQEGATVVVEGDTIRAVEVGRRVTIPSGATVIDLRGKTLMPGLIDAHVHMGITEAIPSHARRFSEAVYVCKVAANLRETLLEGFTTVRDAGGAYWGFKEALQMGLIEGPRLLISGRSLSQTGGHGDSRHPYQSALPSDEDIRVSSLICDGVDAVRRGAREQLRLGADQIKVMAGGGAMSPTDELDTTQYSIPELRAAVEEAEAAGTYVMAHVYSPRSICNALEAGVRSLEHGNLLDEASARQIKARGAYLVPTLATYEIIARQGKEYGIGPENLRKINLAREKSFEALQIAYTTGVKIASGSDLLGPMHIYKGQELALKGEVMRPMDVLLATTRVNAELLQLADRIGTVEAGKWADLIVVDGNPLEDLTLWQRHQTSVLLVMKGGKIYKNLL